MSFLDKLEDRFGRLGIPHLIRYIIIAKAATFVACIFFPMLAEWLILEPSLVKAGQLWRVVTFPLAESPSLFIGVANLMRMGYSSLEAYTQVSLFRTVLYTAIRLYFYFWVGQLLESSWGSFKTTLYFLLGLVFNVIGALLFNVQGDDLYLFETLFFAVAVLYPDVQILLFFIIPLKMKIVGIISGVLYLVQVIQYASLGAWGAVGYMLFQVLNFLLFFIPELARAINGKARSERYQREVRKASAGPRQDNGSNVYKVAFHRCAVCGKTELDDPNMTFRYCSECSGLYEYCADHLYNHTHVK